MLRKLKYKRFFISALWTTWLFALSQYAYAATEPTLGQAAGNMLEPIGLLQDGLHKICFIIGGMLIVGAGLQYKSHRENPSAVRISTPIVLFLLGLALILLPLISMQSSASQAAAGAAAS